MNILGYTTTTTDYPFLTYLDVALKSLKQYNDFKVILFVLDKGINKIPKYENVELIDFSECKTKTLEINKLTCKVEKCFNFGNDKFLSVLVGPECLDYIYKNYNYDVLFRFDTDVLFTGKIDFLKFLNSDKPFGGCKELFWHTWTKETFGFSVTDRDVYNVGLSMFRKSKQVPNMYERMLEYFKEKNYKINTFEQDAINEVYEDAYDLSEQFILVTNRETTLEGKTAIHFNGNHLKPLSLRLFKLYDFLRPVYAKWNKDVNDKNLEFELKRKAFYSSCDGDKFIDLLIVTVTSYKLHNSLAVDWIIICKDNDSIQNVKKRTEFLSDEKVKMIYTVMPDPPIEVDYKKYNTFKWTSDYASEIFCKRIYFVDVWKYKYDFMCCVDLDCLFIDNVEPIIRDFMDSDYAVGGALEPFSLRYGFEACLKMEMPEIPYNFDKYVNFGFGMLNTRFIRSDNYKRFIELSKGKEVFFNTQEQAYFACEYQNTIKGYEDLQCLIWGRLPRPSHYRHPYKYKMIHFSPSIYLTSDIRKLDTSELRYANTVLFYRKYAETVLKCRGISSKFRNITVYNLQRWFSDFEKLKIKNELKI